MFLDTVMGRSRVEDTGDGLLSQAPQPVQNFVRSSEFFARVAVIYSAYKVTQLKAAAMRLQCKDPKQLWHAQHTWAGEQMYDLCISLRGFYLKVRAMTEAKVHLWAPYADQFA